MNIKRISPLLIGLVGLLIGVGIDYFNIVDLQFVVGEPLTNFSLLLLITSIALFFSREETFQSWLRFSYWWIPLSVLILAITPTTGHDWALGGPTREIMSWVMGGLFFLISLAIIVVKSWKRN